VTHFFFGEGVGFVDVFVLLLFFASFQFVTFQIKIAMMNLSFALLLALFTTIHALSTSAPKSRRAFLNAGAAITATSFTASSPAFAGIPPTGVKAPAFDLPNSRGEGFTSLETLTKTGKWTVLYFYPGAFTSGCTLEARGFQRDIEQYKKLGAQIVGVSVDAPEKNAQFCTAEGLDFYMLSDTNGRVSKEYGSAITIPGFGSFSNRQTYIIDPDGNLRWVFTDVESKIARHSAEVLEKLSELKA
jgi:thioredoxin-dependent peroxiredoxin